MNLILGSGVVGLVARHILGPEWVLVPFGRSRYYSHDIPFSDNYITIDSDVDDFIEEFNKDRPILFYKRPFSHTGQLMYQEVPLTVDSYLSKVYGDAIPSVADKLLKTNLTVYSITCLELNRSLSRIYIDEINSRVASQGKVVSIRLSDKTVSCENQVLSFDNIVSTIPLNALYDYCNLSCDLRSKDTCFYWIRSDKVDLEGAETSLVCDSNIAFYKVYKISANDYIFCTFEPLDNPLSYFGQFIGYNFDLMEARRIKECFPLGDPPDSSLLDSYNIFCVGSNAEWDDFRNISSCIKRLLGYSGRFK